MSVYLIIVLEKTKPLEVKAVEAKTVDEAVTAATALYRGYPTATTYQIWRDGKRVGNGRH